MTAPDAVGTNLSDEAESLALGSLEWLLGQARDTGHGALAWTGTPTDDELDPTLYSGAAGIVVALLEGRAHFGDERYGDAAVRGARSIAAALDAWEYNSLYFGLAGMALALHEVHRTLGDEAAGAAVGRALALLRERFDGERWGEQFELLGGNAGIALGALHCGDPELALLAVTPYLWKAEPTAGGVNWEVRSGAPARFHHISHGTLGIAYALVAVGRATGRADLVELGLAGVADVVARDEAGPEGFLVPHSDPQHRPEDIERYSYGWCHGPAGDAQVFRLVGSTEGESAGNPVWAELADRCWHTVTTSGLPRRLRPGFWDNSGRCCGTAGVLALACDRSVERHDGPEFARTLVEDIAARATVDASGARWSNVEHRVTPSALEPRTGWAMGNAGIVRELMRFARLGTGRAPGYAIQLPDHPVAVAPPAV